MSLVGTRPPTVDEWEQYLIWLWQMILYQNNRVKDISAFPKRLRFYHAIIDSRSLKSGEDFGKLNHPYAEGYNAVWTN